MTGLLPVMCADSQCAVDLIVEWRDGCLATSRGAADNIPVVPSDGCPEYVVAGAATHDCQSRAAWMKSPCRQRLLTIPAYVTFRLPASCNELALRDIQSRERSKYLTPHVEHRQLYSAWGF